MATTAESHSVAVGVASPCKRGRRAGTGRHHTGLTFRHGSALVQGLSLDDAAVLVERFGVSGSQQSERSGDAMMYKDGKGDDNVCMAHDLDPPSSVDAEKAALVRDLAFKVIERIACCADRQFSGVWQAAATLDYASDLKLKSVLRDVNSAAAVLHHVNGTWCADVLKRVDVVTGAITRMRDIGAIAVDGASAEEGSTTWRALVALLQRKLDL